MDITRSDRFVECCTVTETAINLWQTITGLDLIVRKVANIKISLIPQQLYTSPLKTPQKISRHLPIMSLSHHNSNEFYKILKKKTTNVFRK